MGKQRQGQPLPRKLYEGPEGCCIPPCSCSSQRDPKPAAFLPYLLSGSLPGFFLPRRRVGTGQRGPPALAPLLTCFSSAGKEREVPPRCSNPAGSSCFLSWETPGSLHKKERAGRRKSRGRRVCKHLPRSSLEQALPLFELEVGTQVALSKQGSVEFGATCATERQQVPPPNPAPWRAWCLAEARGFWDARETLRTVLTSHPQEKSFCWFLQLWEGRGKTQLRFASPGAARQQPRGQCGCAATTDTEWLRRCFYSAQGELTQPWGV